MERVKWISTHQALSPEAFSRNLNVSCFEGYYLYGVSLVLLPSSPHTIPISDLASVVGLTLRWRVLVVILSLLA